jgi:hypothetical protein
MTTKSILYSIMDPKSSTKNKWWHPLSSLQDMVKVFRTSWDNIFYAKTPHTLSKINTVRRVYPSRCCLKLLSQGHFSTASNLVSHVWNGYILDPPDLRNDGL